MVELKTDCNKCVHADVCMYKVDKSDVKELSKMPLCTFDVVISCRMFVEETKVETETFFDDSAFFNRLISTIHESNRVYECSKCVNFDQDTDVKKKHCAWCTEYDEFIRKE